MEEVDPEVRKKLPRSKDDHIISGAFIQRTLLNSFVMVTGIMIVYAIEAKDGEERRVTTMVR